MQQGSLFEIVFQKMSKIHHKKIIGFTLITSIAKGLYNIIQD
jgi:hypothetical protein